MKMYEIRVKGEYAGCGVRIPAGLTVRVACVTNPLAYGPQGKQIIAEAFWNQCGIDVSNVVGFISTGFLEVKEM